MQLTKSEWFDDIKLKKRNELHLARKLFHAAGVGFVIGLYFVLPRDIAILTISACCLVFIPLDFLRTKWRPANFLFVKAFSRFLRSEEKTGLTGTSYLLVAVLILVAFFPQDISILALAMLAIGDPVASIAGVMYGKDKLIGNKSLQGSMAAFFSCFLLSLIYFYLQNLMTERLLLVSILAGLIAAFSELIPVGKLDDNLSFPVMAACLLYGLFILFGGIV